VADCIKAHVPALDCWIRDKMRDYFKPYNRMLFKWINETKEEAPRSEVPFYPEFVSPNLLPCVKDSRKLLNIIIKVDDSFTPPKTCCRKVQESDANSSLSNDRMHF
jgi:hypothetical protein